MLLFKCFDQEIATSRGSLTKYTKPLEDCGLVKSCPYRLRRALWDFKKTKLWHKEFKNLGYDSKLIFKKAKTKFEILSSLSFFLTIMASEILLNQPIKKKINIIHNNFLYKFMSKDSKKVDRVEINSFSFSLFMILQKLFTV